MATYNVDIVTPIQDLALGDVSYLRCPGLDGSFGVMSNHRDGIFALSVGEIKVTQNGKDEYYATGGGFAEIVNDSVKFNLCFSFSFRNLLKSTILSTSFILLFI